MKLILMNPKRSKIHKSGLDYTKIVILDSTEYLDTKDAIIDQDEYNETMINLEKIKKKVRNIPVHLCKE